jgi:hypothetical protein
MTTLAITIIEPAIGPVTRGTLSVLWRVGATMSGIKVGDKLWVREPFHLPRGANHLSPTVAHQRSMKPTFVADLSIDGPDPASWLGSRRAARTMLRVWHRQHLIVTGIEWRRVHSITEPEARAQGYGGINHFARGWDKNLMFGGHDARWDMNPVATVFSFDRVGKPLP